MKYTYYNDCGCHTALALTDLRSRAASILEVLVQISSILCSRFHSDLPRKFAGYVMLTWGPIVDKTV